MTKPADRLKSGDMVRRKPERATEEWQNMMSTFRMQSDEVLTVAKKEGTDGLFELKGIDGEFLAEDFETVE